MRSTAFTHCPSIALFKAPFTPLAMALRRVPCSSLSSRLYNQEASPWNFTLKWSAQQQCRAGLSGGEAAKDEGGEGKGGGLTKVCVGICGGHVGDAVAVTQLNGCASLHFTWVDVHRASGADCKFEGFVKRKMLHATNEARTMGPVILAPMVIHGDHSVLEALQFGRHDIWGAHSDGNFIDVQAGDL